MTSVSSVLAVQCLTPVLQDDAPLAELTAGNFVAWFEGQGISACEVHSEYNALLEQRGLMDKQIPSGANPVMPGDQKSLIIARPDLYLQAYRKMCVQRHRVGSLTTFPSRISTGTCFLSLHDLNLSHRANIRGEINHLYNQLLAQSSGGKYLPIPGNDFETLDLSGQNEKYPAVVVNPKLYFQAMGEILQRYDKVQPAVSTATTIDVLSEKLFCFIFDQLDLRDLASARRVCRKWQIACDAIPLSGPIDAWFSEFVIKVGSQFWESVKRMKSQHPESVGKFSGETIDAFLARKSAECQETAEDLEAVPGEGSDFLKPIIDDLRHQAAEYKLNCKGTWTRLQLASAHQMMRSVRVEDYEGFGIVLMPERYSPRIHQCLCAAANGHFPLHRNELKEWMKTPSFAPATLYCFTNDNVVGTRKVRGQAERDAMLTALHCTIPELLPFLLYKHDAQIVGHSLRQDNLLYPSYTKHNPSVVVGNELMWFQSNWPVDWLLVWPFDSLDKSGIGVGAQRKFPAKKSI